MKNTKTIKVKATAKIEEFKNWVYKHFIGVYIGIAAAFCMLMFIFGFMLGQSVSTCEQTSEHNTHTVSVDKGLSCESDSGAFEIIIRSIANE